MKNKYLIWFILFFGIFLRLVQYLSNRSLWLDESSLALNIVNKSFLDFFRPLDYEQTAPIGFLFLEKIAINFFGNNEFALRLFPLIAGCVSIALFYYLAKKYTNGLSLYISLILFILSVHLIYYSSEVKQYSFDLFVALILYNLFLLVDSRYHVSLSKQISSNLKLYLITALIGFFALWFSEPSVFILASFVSLIFIDSLFKKNLKELITFIPVFIFWGISFALIYFLVLSNSLTNQGLKVFWQSSFAPFPNLSNLNWYKDTFLSIFDIPLGLQFSLIGGGFFIIGLFFLYRKDKRRLFLLILPILITLLASFYADYPFYGRFLIFLSPIFIILTGLGVGEMISRKNVYLSTLTIFFLIALIAPPAITAGYNVLHPIKVEEIRPVISYYKDHKREGDTLYIYHAAELPYKYYAERFDLKDRYIVASGRSNNLERYIKDLNKLRGKKRIWFLFSHVLVVEGVNPEEFVIRYLNSIGIRREYFFAPDASIYLYDLNPR